MILGGFQCGYIYVGNILIAIRVLVRRLWNRVQAEPLDAVNDESNGSLK